VAKNLFLTRQIPPKDIVEGQIFNLSIPFQLDMNVVNA
jgi:hypothetical protein